MARDPLLHADNMLGALANIATDLEGHDFESFRADRRTRQLVERNLEILSEASRHLPEELKRDEPGVPWKAVAGIGNVLRHDYHRAWPAMLWETCAKDLRPLQAAVARIRDRLVASR